MLDFVNSRYLFVHLKKKVQSCKMKVEIADGTKSKSNM